MSRVAVVGGGAAGYAAALEAAGRGHAVTLVERENLGGVCLHTGCVPTRVYLEAIRRAEAYGALTRQQAPLPERDALRRQAEMAIGELVYGIRHMVRRGKIQWLTGTARLTGPGLLTVEGAGENRQVEWDKLVLATGSRPKQLPMAAGATLHTVDELLTLNDLPDAVTVVGGGVLGVELAVILRTLGVQVCLQEAEGRILPHWDPDISAGLARDLAGRGVVVEVGTTAPATGHVVVCAGREPVLPRSDWQAWNDAFKAGRPTEALGVYRIGDCTGRSGEAATALEEGRAVVDALERNEALAACTDALAQCIFTPLEAACVGLTAEQAGQKGMDCAEVSVPLSTTAVGKLSGSGDGFVKGVMERTGGRLVGWHILAVNASEIIGAAALTLQNGMTAEQVAALRFPHPTLCECLKEAAVGLRRKQR